jgi:hypothetical protein
VQTICNQLVSVFEGQNCQKLDTITVKGRIAKSWTPLQSTDFAGQQLRNTGKSWAAALTLAIWELSWQMWDHRNDILHNSDVYDHLIDMDATDFSILRNGTQAPITWRR